MLDIAQKVFDQIYTYFPCLRGFIETREVTAVLQTTSKKVNSGIHSVIYELSLLKLCVMIDATELYVSILLYVTLILTQGQGDARNQKPLCHLSPMVMNVCGWNLVCY